MRQCAIISYYLSRMRELYVYLFFFVYIYSLCSYYAKLRFLVAYIIYILFARHLDAVIIYAKLRIFMQ